MSARQLLLAALAMLAACGGTSSRPGVRLNGPSAIAVFRGVTTRDAANLRSYMAIANERGDDLRLLDAVDGKAVLAPGLVMSLSVPTAPRPALLAAGSLADEGAPKADLLAVAPAGLAACDRTAPTRLAGCIQVVATWDPATAVDSALTIDLATLAGGLHADAEVLSLAVVPVPVDDGAGGWKAAAGKARLVAGLSGGRLLLADFVRATGGEEILPAGTAAVHAVGFDPVSLSASPDLRHVYAATPDPVAGVEGVAELDLSGAVDALPGTRAIAAGAPTRLVLAATVREFAGMPDPTSPKSPKPDQYGPQVLRVYAALEPTRCGLDWPVACGIAVLDPALGGPAPDPAGELPGRAPIPILGQPLAMAAVYPPTWGGGTLEGDPVNPPAAPAPLVVALQKLNVPLGLRWASTLAAVASSKGQVALLDLGKSAQVTSQSLVYNTTYTRTTSASGEVIRVLPDGTANPPEAGLPFLGLWDDRDPSQPATVVKTRDPTTMRALVRLTPGYTTSEGWLLTWQGRLPGLTGVKAHLEVGAAGVAWLAVQQATGLAPPAEPFRHVARLYDVRLGLRPGDVVEVTPDDAACPDTFDLTVTSLLPPDAALHPGGAVAVSGALPDCLVRAPQAAAATFRSGGLLLAGTSSGYAGRPQIDTTFALRWEDEAALTCPMLQGAAWPPPACDDACRDQCERLLLARKARRLAYVAEDCTPVAESTSRAACEARWAHLWTAEVKQLEPNPVGPVIAFRPGWVDEEGGAPDPTLAPRRGTVLRIDTESALEPASRLPLSSGTANGDVLPSGLATFDRSATTGAAADGVRVLASYPSNLVLDFTPADASSAVTVHR